MCLTRKEFFESETYQLMFWRNSEWDKRVIREILEKIDKDLEAKKTEK